MQEKEYFSPLQNMCEVVPNYLVFLFKSCHPLGKKEHLLLQAHMISTLYGKSDQLSPVFSQSPHYSFEVSVVLGGGLAAEWSKVGSDHPHR